MKVLKMGRIQIKGDVRVTQEGGTGCQNDNHDSWDSQATDMAKSGRIMKGRMKMYS